jgi:Zn-dependent protease with chaperone function
MWVQYYDVVENETFIQYYFALGVILFLFWGWAINLKKGNNNISIGKKQVNIEFSMLFVLFFLIFITFVILSLWFSKRSRYLELTKIIHTNSYKIVEGNVKNFVPEKKPQ